MPIPAEIEPRRYYRVAKLRYEDAEYLLRGGRNNAAIYIAGYTVECILKALILSNEPPDKHVTVLREFRGSAAHNYEHLKDRYLGCGGAKFPTNVVRAFTYVRSWNVQLRYDPKRPTPGEAREFLRSAEVLFEWADGRL